MAPTDGASPKDTSADAVLAGALSEMVAEGAQLDKPISSDAGSGEASQSAGSASAATAGAPPKVTGDAGSGPADGSPSTPATLATPDPSAAPEPAADPLAGTEPFTYEVAGEKKTLQGVYRVPGEGLLVPEDQVSTVQALAERADVLDRVTREVTAKHADLERLTTWDVTDDTGKVLQSLKGSQGLEAMRVDYARQSAALSVMDAILSDPAKFAQLVGVDAAGKIVVDPTALEYLQKDVMLAAGNAERSARSQFQQLSTPARPEPASVDHSRSAPAIIDQVAKTSGFDSKLLTEKDRQFLGQQIGRYVRTVTEDDRRFNPSLQAGAPIVDASFMQVIRDRAELRQEATKTAKAAEVAGKHNAGMDKGRQPAAKAAAAKPATPAPAAPAGRKKADWDSPLESALTEMGVTR